jgi:hypothetical protein
MSGWLHEWIYWCIDTRRPTTIRRRAWSPGILCEAYVARRIILMGIEQYSYKEEKVHEETKIVCGLQLFVFSNGL